MAMDEEHGSKRWLIDTGLAAKLVEEARARGAESVLECVAEFALRQTDEARAECMRDLMTFLATERGGRMSKVERRHRELALGVMCWEDGDKRVDGWLDTGGDTWTIPGGRVTSMFNERRTAQAIADAEARGRAAERADVVAWIRDQKWVEAIPLPIERGEHVGAAGKEREDG